MSGSEAPPAHTDVGRGRERLPDPRVWGTIVGAIGGSVFVHANSAVLEAPWRVVAIAAWAVALAFWIWSVFLAPRTFLSPQLPGPRAGLVYLGSVVGMIALIQVGRLALGDERADVLPAVIVLAVGLHFLPFASAFHAPLFTRLGAVMVVLGALGLVLGLSWAQDAAGAIAVLTGVVMLVLIGADARTPS